MSRLVAITLLALLGCSGQMAASGPDADPVAGGADAGALADAAAGTDSAAPLACATGTRYGTLVTAGAVTDRPAAEHADLNIALRGWTATTATLGLVDVGGPTDVLAPQLPGLFADQRTPTFVANYRVNNWDWSQNAAAGPITESEVSLTALATVRGELVRAPASGYDIGAGYAARVLYATEDSVTLKYTGEDNIVSGYAIHLIGLCTDPALLALYREWNAAGRAELPAVRAGEAVGRATGEALRVSVRDTGAFMDPRVRKDWWAGR